MMKFRPGTIDEDAWDWVVRANEYGLPPTLDAGAVVVDVGVHIGSFVEACWSRGARDITGYEVDAENYGVAQHNVGARPGVRLHNVAVDRSDERFTGTVRFGGYTPRDHGGVNTGSGDIFGGDLGPTVAALRFDDVPGGRGGRIDLLKLDCEGAEWPILYTASSLARVRAIVGEYHTLPREVEAALGLARPCTPDALGSFLAEAGFDQVEIEAPNGVHHGVYQCGKFRATRGPA